jgi:hypothetical protein
MSNTGNGVAPNRGAMTSMDRGVTWKPSGASLSIVTGAYGNGVFVVIYKASIKKNKQR